MATILPNGVSQFIDGNGNPLANGTVTFYIPNTTTPKDTWSDPDENTLNANPLPLDSSGEAIIYGSGSYRQIVKDANGNIIWDQLTASTTSGGEIFGGTSAGTANAQTISAAAFNGTDGSTLTYIAGLTNTSALTLTIGVSSPIPIVRDGISGPTALTGSETVVGNAVSLIYDAGRGAFHLIQTVVSAIGQAVGHAATQAAAQAALGVVPGTDVQPFQAPQAQALWSGGGGATESTISPTKLVTAMQYMNLHGLIITVTSNTALTIVAGGGLSLSAALTTSGVNGLDTGAEAANTFYFVWVIWNSTTGAAASLLSASATAPTMPAGYVQKQRVGAVRNDASSNLWRTLQVGNRVQIQIGTNPTTSPVMATGSTSGAWSATSVTSFVPSTAAAIRGHLIGGAGDNTVVLLAPNSNYSTSFSSQTNGAPVGNGNSGITGSTIYTNEQFELILESTNISYLSNTSRGTVMDDGWVDNLNL